MQLIRSSFLIILRGLFASLLLLGLSGCMVKMTPKKSAVSKKTVLVKSDSKAPDFALKLRGLDLHQYQAQLQWPADLVRVRVLLNDQLLFSEEKPQAATLHLDLEDQKDYELRIFGERRDTDSVPSETPLAEWKFRTPTDLWLDQTYLNSLRPSTSGRLEVHADRLFLAPATAETPALLTNGAHLLIVVDELIAQSSQLITFPENQKAAVDQPGRSGGLIIIKTRSARGHLSVVMRGEQGGDGSIGAPYTDRAPRGAQGTKGKTTCDFYPYLRDSNGYCMCAQPIGDGQPGLPGIAGRPGNSGRRGGNNGQFRLEISEVASEDWEIDIKHEPGLAGAPGPGGPGQLGGVGGHHGEIDDRWACRYVVPKDGPEGPPGPTGPIGGREPNGEVDPVCISVGKGFGRCSD